MKNYSVIIAKWLLTGFWVIAAILIVFGGLVPIGAGIQERDSDSTSFGIKGFLAGLVLIYLLRKFKEKPIFLLMILVSISLGSIALFWNWPDEDKAAQTMIGYMGTITLLVGGYYVVFSAWEKHLKNLVKEKENAKAEQEEKNRTAGEFRRDQEEQERKKGGRKDEVQNGVQSPYEVLGVHESDTLASIKEVYRKLMHIYHPDKTNSASSNSLAQDQKTKLIQKMNVAYEWTEKNHKS